MKSFTRIFLLLLIFQANLSLAQIHPLENCREELKQLEQEMITRYEEYFKKYTFEGVTLKSITLYQYNEKNELIREKSTKAAKEHYFYVNHYENGKKVRLLGNYYDEEKLELKKYDRYGRETESKKYTFESTETDRYRYETIENTKLLQITKMYQNDILTLRSVNRNIKDNIHESLLYRGDDTSVYFKTITYLSPDMKRTERCELYMYEDGYSKIETFQYSKDLLTSYVSYKVGEDTTENRYQYDKNGREIKEEEYENGKLQQTCYKEYDAKGNNTLVKSYWGSGTICYICVYEYDSRGNKISYLYFYSY